MIGGSGSGTGSLRRDHSKMASKATISPLHAKTTATGRITPVRSRQGDIAKANSLYETPTNKILNNIPATVTNRSSERRRRMRGDALEQAEKPNFGPAFVVARSSKVTTPTAFDGPRVRERSDSAESGRSENTPQQPRKLAKVANFSVERVTTTMTTVTAPLQPSNRNEN